MTLTEAMEADSAVLLGMDREMEEVAEMVRSASMEFDESRDEWVKTGLDVQKLDQLANRILARRRISVG